MLQDMVKVEEVDSGVESLPESSKDMTPEKVPPIEDDYENEEDETLAERLLGLTEMFPESIRNTAYLSYTGCTRGVKGLFGFSKSASWIFVSSFVILVAPFMLEIERTQFMIAQQSHQKQVLLGPNSAVSPGGFVPGMHGLSQ